MRFWNESLATIACTSARNVLSSAAAARTTPRTTGMSPAASSRPIAYVISRSANVETNASERASKAARKSCGPRRTVPSTMRAAASIG